MRAVIHDWPSGSKRVTAQFDIEQSKRGERALRQTTGAAKMLTYAKMARIVDGSDGRTYIANLTEFGHISDHARRYRSFLKRQYFQKTRVTQWLWSCLPDSCNIPLNR